MTMTTVKSCTTTACAFNDGGCTALAITVGGSGAKASCDTFVALDARAALSTPSGQVGACKRLECVHNTDLLCTAGAIDVAGDTADCLSYEAS
ncbi:MAG: DUF1540 domain-containing protein [Propionicimonas sp.]|uniref:DUF1540 domain-containing protein n=1 Tax=Propionicimonas sp. TaxID=1955623 RepID=UPI003D113094